MEIVKIKKGDEETTVDIDLLQTTLLILLLGWAFKGLVRVNVNGKQ